MNKGLEVARGKTKALYEYDGQPDVLVVQQLDSISAGDGVRRNEISGKGRLAAQTTARVFRLLNLCGLPTHYLSGGEDDDNNEMLVRRCAMIPLEVVTRGVAAGSLVKRNPSIARGSVLVPRMLEFFFKDDANHDPLITPDEIIARGLATPQEVSAMGEIARLTFEILAHAWRRREVLLVDLKIEFGRILAGENRGSLVIADVIDNDSWRIWPQGREELMLDKQMYRNLPEVTEADLDRIREAYENVAEQVGSFPQMRPAMVAVIADGIEHEARAQQIAKTLGSTFGIPSMRRVASATLMPTYALQIAQQLDATFPSLVYVTVGDHGRLAQMLDAATTTPVIDAAQRTNESIALDCAKSLAIDNTVLFGRVMLAQANGRSAIVQADNVASTPQQLPPGPIA
jgi:phosphoribosylaminoimidazole-succinocarboxamide synthase